MARDLIHEAIKQALINDGWIILKDPYRIELVDDAKFYQVDLAADKHLDAKKGNREILVEIKTLSGTSILHQFHGILGQYLLYRDAMREQKIHKDLYLAVSSNGLDKLNEIKFIRRRIAQYDIKIICVSLQTEKILQWIR